MTCPLQFGLLESDGALSWRWRLTSVRAALLLLLSALCLGEARKVDTLEMRGREMDYLEIGTATFGTLCEHRRGSGISVDMISEYVSSLRKRFGDGRKIFVVGAIVGANSSRNSSTNDSGTVTINMVNPRFVKAGCEAIGTSLECRCGSAGDTSIQYLESLGIEGKCLPHAFLGMHSLLTPAFLEWVPPEKIHHLLIRRRVPAFSVGQLIRRLKVISVRHVKVDAEGFDAHIILGLARFMAVQLSFRPAEISWECFHLMEVDRVRSMRAIALLGYRCGRVSTMDCGCALGLQVFTWHTE